MQAKKDKSNAYLETPIGHVLFFPQLNLTALKHRGIHDPTSNGYILFFYHPQTKLISHFTKLPSHFIPFSLILKLNSVSQ
jgi:hypothetical protein